MILEYILVGTLFLLSLLNIIFYKGKRNKVLYFISIIACLLIIAFIFLGELKPFILYYDILLLVLIVTSSLLLINKKVTKNITEYDFFELESAYKDLEDDREKLRQRYLSTISLIEEGIVFYENGLNDVILSDRALSIFGGEQSTSLEKHSKLIYEFDRDEYLKEISRAGKNNPFYSVQYRLDKGDELMWVQERGHYIGLENKKSIIASVMPLDVKLHKPSLYFDIDSIKDESLMYPVLKELLDSNKTFYYVSFELSNIPELNKKYTRDMGSLMMSEYLKMIKLEFGTNSNRLFRTAGIRYALILEDENEYKKLHDYLVNSESILYKSKVRVSAVKENVVANFSVIKLDGSYSPSEMDVVNLSEQLLEEAIASKRKNYIIYND